LNARSPGFSRRNARLAKIVPPSSQANSRRGAIHLFYLTALKSCHRDRILIAMRLMSQQAPNESPSTAGGSFRTTCWTYILEAARPDAPGSENSFARLYLDYWPPLYAYLRRRGFGSPAAKDVTQDFFTRLLEKSSLANLQKEGGRFRSFLLGALNNFLANEWDRAHAQKRGGGQELLSLDATEGETRFLSRQPAESSTPETVFEQQWAMTLLEHVTRAVAADYAANGKAALFEQLRVYLQGDRGGPPYAEAAARLGLSEGAVKVAVHRLRQRYGQLLREELARVVSRPEDVDEELRHLIQIVGR